MEAPTRRRGPLIGRSERQRALLDRPWKVRLLQTAILVVVLIGAATGPLALLRAGAERGQTGTAAAPPSPVGATGFAQLFVAAWLNQADPDHPETLAAFDPDVTAEDLTGMVPGQLYAARTVAIDATPAGPDYWAVTVAAEVLQSVKGSLRPAGTRFYGVGIQAAGGRFIATSLPEQINPPPTAAARPTFWVEELLAPQPDDPLADTLTQFFTAMLAGKGELERYVDPQSGLAVLKPAPCTQVVLRAYGQTPFGTNEAVAKAQVSCQDAARRINVLEYWLDLEQTQGRWEVTRLHRAAPIASLEQQQENGG